MLKKIIPWILILSGLLLIGTALYQRFETIWHQNELVRQYEEYAEQLKKQKSGPSDKSPEASSILPAETSQLPAVLENPDESKKTKIAVKEIPKIIGVMKIPKIGLSVAIGEGSDYKAMRYTVGHFSNTAQPGRKGNFAVIGHRSYRYGQFFNRLDELKKGDAIVVESGTNTYSYKVTEVLTVKPEDTWVLDKSDDATITLITCTPIRIATHRLILKGVLEKTG